MGIFSWLFPTEDDRLRRARKLMAAGRHEDARSGLVRCTTPAAEALYDECCAAVEKGERVTTKKRLASEGFHGWKIEVTVASAKKRAELEGLVADELAKAGVDLDLPDIDQAAVQTAVVRAQRRVRKPGSTAGMVKLVPIVAAR